MAVGPEETLLSDLVARWEELHEQGQEVSIEELCAGNREQADELRRRIAALQQWDALRNTSVLFPTPEATPDMPAARSNAPGRSGASCTATYHDLRFHARGGLGEVFRAHGDDLHRDVALKFLNKRVAHEPDSQRRFLQEAEVTGRLDTPGIVPVYSLGQDEQGQPCYAMRFISGQTLDEAIQEFHAAAATAGPDQRNHALRAMIKRFVTVCNTIAYAHSRGVLHRDIKPKNIMLGKYDETLVVDWGLARSFDRNDSDRWSGEETLRPMSGDSSSGTPTVGVIGTPAFMSPEQAHGHHNQVGSASDIYSLGASLYVILTGRTAADGRNVGEVIEQVRHGVFPPPHQVGRNVPRALDAICRKAMALQIEDRYVSALDLADDLETWLADEPVTAWREPVLTRFTRWGRRHKTAVASGTVLLATAALAMTLANVFLGRQNEEILRQKTLVDAQSRRAEQNFNVAQDAVGRMLAEVGQVELEDVPQMEPIRARLLDKASRYYLTFLAQKEADPSVRLQTALAHRRLGDIQEMLGDYLAAEPSYREAIRLLDARADQSPESRQELARGQTGLGILLKKSRRYHEARQALEAAIALWKDLAEDAPDNLEFQQAFADSRYHWATLLARMPGKRSDSEKVYGEVIEQQKKLQAAAHDKPEFRRDHARLLNNLGMLLMGSGRYREAEDNYTDALEIQQRLVKEAPTVPGHRWLLARIYNNLGHLREAINQPGEAQAYYDKAREPETALRGDFPSVATYTLELAMILNNLGRLRAREAAAAAEQDFRQAEALLEELVSRFPKMPDYRFELALTRLHLAILVERNDPAVAEQTYHKARELQVQLVREFPDVPEYQDALGRTFYSLSFLIRARHGPLRAQSLLEDAVKYQREALKANPQNPLYRTHLGNSLGLLAATLTSRGNHADAARTVEELPLIMPDDPEEHLRAAAILTQCMTLASEEGTKSDYFRRAMRVLTRAASRGLLRNPAMLDRADFAPLGDREEFKTLRDRLKNGARIGVG